MLLNVPLGCMEAHTYKLVLIQLFLLSEWDGGQNPIPSPPALLKMPLYIESRGNYCLQSRESKTSCCPFLPSCLAHLQHLACSHLETNTPNLSLALCEVWRVLTHKAMAWAVCGWSFFKLFLFKQQVSVVWVNPVCLHTEPRTAHHVLWLFSKDLAPHRPRRKVHEYSIAPSTLHLGAPHCEKRKVWYFLRPLSKEWNYESDCMFL